MTDGNGHQTQYTYDNRKALTSITNPLGQTESFTYNAVGNVINDTKPDGTKINNTYDILNRVASVSYQAPPVFGSTKQTALSSTIKGSDLLNPLKIITMSNPSTGTIDTSSGTSSSDTSSDSNDVVNYSYDVMGNRTSMKGSEGETDYVYDKMGRLIDVNSPTEEDVKYEYDELGRKSKLIYPDGRYVTYSYDDLNRMTAAIDSDGNKTTYIYDAGNRRIETDLPNGDKVKYTYNEANQIVSLEYISKEGVTQSSFQYTYDSAGNIIKEVQNDSDGIKVTRTYSYDGSNELIGFTEQENDGEVKKYDYCYDKAGNRISVQITGDDAKTISYKYNSADELTSEVDGDKNISYEYDANGNRTKKILPGDHVEYYDYDIEGRLAQFTDVNGGIETFGYDGDGNRLYRTIGYTLQAPTDGKGDNNGSYDNGQGKDKGNHYGEKISSKPSSLTGFWIFQESSSSNGNNGNNGNNGKNSGDDNGNGKDKGNHNSNGNGNNGKHLGWYKKAQKPKLHGKSPSDNTTYEVTNYINDVNQANPQVLMTSDENGTYKSAYTYGVDRISVSTLGITDDKYTPLYYQYDGRGSVTGLVGNADNIEARYSYDAFGVPKPGVKLDTKENGFINPYGYNGEENDTYSGLQYLRARYYEADTGRFLSRDSYLGDLMNPLTLNRYDYTGNNPVMYSDPSGNNAQQDGGGVGNTSTISTVLLGLGSTGDDVRAMQQNLIDLGYNLGTYGADGIFGKITDKAVRAFQAHYKLDVDGIVGPQTREALQAAIEGKAASVQTGENSDGKKKCGDSQGTNNGS
jgi:RHS repeat-associated protein